VEGGDARATYSKVHIVLGKCKTGLTENTVGRPCCDERCDGKYGKGVTAVNHNLDLTRATSSKALCKEKSKGRKGPEGMSDGEDLGAACV